MDYELPLTVDTGRGFSINYRGQSLYSLYNPSKTPERIALTEKLEEETLYILPSPLLFYGVGILLSRLPESSFLLGIECDQKLMKLSLNNSGVLEHKQFELVRLDTREQLKQMFDNLGVWRFRRCKAIFLNKGYNINNEIYDYLIDYAVHHLNTFWKNRLTLNKLGSLWIKNLFQNLSVENSATPDNKGKPVIICGAGPSLEGVIDLLKGYRDKIYILAVDTALSTLLDRQIIPDLVYALESQFYNLGDFHNTGNHVFSLLADITSYPHICRTNKGPVFFTQTDFAETILLRRLKESGLSLIHLPPLGSVGVAAVYAAMTIFSEQLYLTGLDFSYVPGKSHSKGSPFVKSILRNIDRLHPLENSSGFNRRPLMRIPG
ncbi:MAG: DUF115 domain-containing protein, partial [Spirochaetales bacterium]|nr:DUF115 domain-containing protein [Spirochaetales bacterium]